MSSGNSELGWCGMPCPALPVLRRMYGTFRNANGSSKARHLDAEGITVVGGVQVLLYGYMMKMGFLSCPLTPIVQFTHCIGKSICKCIVD